MSFVKKYASGDLEFEPGSKYSYNNSGYFLLGAIIEQVTGKPYEQVLKENILDPARHEKHRLRSSRHASFPNAPPVTARQPTVTRTLLYLDMSIPYAAGSMYSTVEDLYLWDQALYTDKLLSAQSKELMYKPFLEDYAYGWVVSKCIVQAERSAGAGDHTRRRHQRFHHHDRALSERKESDRDAR